MHASVSWDGERSLRESATGFVKGVPIGVNIELGIETGRCRIYREGWGLLNLIGTINDATNRLTVMKRGWIRSELLVVLGGDPIVFKCGNHFADALRTIFGSDIYL